MIVIDRKFYSKYYNGDTFASNLTDYSTNLTGSVMEYKKAIYTVNVDVSTVLYANSGLSLQANAISGTLDKQSGTWANDGWSVGDEFQASATGGVNPNFTGRILAINGTSLTYIKLTGTDFTGQAFNWNMYLTSNLEGFQFKYGVIENNEPTNYLSPLDNIAQGFYASGVGFDTGGGVRSTTPKTCQPLGQNINKSWINGSATCAYVQNIGHIQQFEVTHEFIIPYYEDGEITNLQTVTPPTDLNGSNSYKYVSEYEFRRVLTDPNSSKIVKDDSTLGSVGYFNEPFNGLNQPFGVTNLTYEDVSANPLTQIVANTLTTVKYRLTNSSGAFASGQKVGLFTSYLPTLSEYQNASNNLVTNFIYDSVYGLADGITVAIASTVIQEYTITFVDASNIDVELKVLYNDSRIDNTKSYLIASEVASAGFSNTIGDKTNLLVDVETFEKSTDVLDLFDVTKMEFEIYPEPQGTNSYTNFRGWVEDPINLTYEFWLDTAKYAFLDGLNVKIVAFNVTDNSYFDLETVQVPLNSGIVVGGIQRFNVNVPRGFNYTGINDYNIISLQDALLVGTKQYYNAQISLKMDWQSWVNLPNADTVFYDVNEPNNGLNENASNYSLKNNYEIRFLIDANVSETTTGTVTNYVISNIENEVYNYDLDNNITPIISGVISTYDGATNLGGVLLTNSPTKIQCLWSSTGIFGLVTDYFGTISLEPVNSTSKNAIKVYDASLSFVGTDLLAEYTISPSDISNGIDYKISSRIFCYQTNETPIARMINKNFTPSNGLFSFDLRLLEADDTTPLVVGDDVRITVKQGATTLEVIEGGVGTNISTFTPVLGSPIPTSSIVNWVSGSANDNGGLVFDKKSYSNANGFDYFSGSLSGSNWVSNAKIIDFYIEAFDTDKGFWSINSDNTMEFERAVDLIEGSCFTQIDNAGTYDRYSLYDNDGVSENYNEQSTFEYYKNGSLISSVLPTFTPTNYTWGTQDLNTDTLTGITSARYLTKIGFNNGMVAESETVISPSDEQLGFSYNRIIGSESTYNKLNLNSITTADKDNVNLGNTYNNLRTVSIRIELTDDINTVTNNGIHTILARYNTSNLTGAYFVRFVNGNIQFLFRNGSSFSQTLSNSNSWTSGQVVDITIQFNSTLGRIMYIDGVLQTNQFSTLKTDSGTSIYNTYLGGTVDVDDQYLFVKVSNLQVWTKELTNTEINSYIGVIPTAGTTGLVECFPFLNETGTTVTGVNGNTGTISTLNAGGVTYVDNTIREDYTVGSIANQRAETFAIESENLVSSTVIDRAIYTNNNYNGSTPSNTVDVRKNAVSIYPAIPYDNFPLGFNGEVDWFNIDLGAIGQRNTIRYQSSESGVEFYSEYQLELNYIY